MVNSELVKLIDFWQKDAVDNKLLRRAVISSIDVKSKEVVDIIGPRRAGKSSVLKLLMKDLLLEEAGFFYMNFEDPYFVENGGPAVINELLETYKEYYRKDLKYLFFDEIQNIESWERVVRTLRDGGSYKIFVTGSSSKLLSGEFASALTGRHLSYQVFPLSFNEFLDFEGIRIHDRKSVILKEISINRLFLRYMKIGGFPEVVLSKNLSLLKQYYFDVLEKDIIKRRAVREKSVIEKMGVFLITNSAKVTSLASLKDLYNKSFETISNYLNYFKEAFLILELPRFSYSLKTQQKALKKYYCVDTGLANAVSFRFSEDKGRLLENIAYLHIRRGFSELYYYKTKSGKEVDFLAKDGGVTRLFNVCWDLRDRKTKERETKSLLEAMQELGLSEGTIFTFEEEGVLLFGNNKIFIRPLPTYLLKDALSS